MINFFSIIVRYVTKFAGFLTAGSIGSLIVTALTQFFSTRGLTILAGLGLTLASYQGLDYVTNDIKQRLLGLTSSMGTGSEVGYIVGLMTYAGLFSALNIVLSFFITSMGIVQLKVFFKRFTGN